MRTAGEPSRNISTFPPIFVFMLLTLSRLMVLFLADGLGWGAIPGCPSGAMAWSLVVL